MYSQDRKSNHKDMGAKQKKSDTTFDLDSTRSFGAPWEPSGGQEGQATKMSMSGDETWIRMLWTAQDYGKSHWTPISWRRTKGAIAPTSTSASCTTTTRTKSWNGSRKTSIATTSRTERLTWCPSTPTGSRLRSWSKGFISSLIGRRHCEYNRSIKYASGFPHRCPGDSRGRIILHIDQSRKLFPPPLFPVGEITSKMPDFVLKKDSPCSQMRNAEKFSSSSSFFSL